jgi:iron complex outermembrane receptor protein
MCEALEFHAAYARGINFPGVYAKFNYEGWGRGDQYLDLKPEVLDHFEVGAAYRFGLLCKFSLTAFHDQGRDRLVFVPPPPPPPKFDNIQDFRIRGTELAVEILLPEFLAFFASVTYLDPKPNDLPRAPTWTATGGLGYRFLEHCQISTDTQYVGEMHTRNPRYPSGPDLVDDFWIWNARFEFAALEKPVNLKFWVLGENLSNVHYEYQPGYPMPGISVSAGVAVKF